MPNFSEIPLAAGVACNTDCPHFRRGDCPYRPTTWGECARKVEAFRKLAASFAKIEKRAELMAQLNEASKILAGLLDYFPPELIKQDKALADIYENIEQAFAAADTAAEDMRITAPLSDEIAGPNLFGPDSFEDWPA